MIVSQNLSFHYDSEKVLEDLSFSIQPGEVIGILGPNGTGKTTLLKILLGLLKNYKGSVTWNGHEIRSLSRSERSSQAAFVPQQEDFLFPFTVRDIVLMGRATREKRWGFETREDLIAADRAIAWTDLNAVQSRSILSLSGGERQRVLVARALAQETSCLILDEPTAHLDIKHQMDMMERLQRLNREKGMTILMSLHDINMASLYCGKILLLKEGKVFAFGAPREVITSAHLQAVYETSFSVSVGAKTGKPYSLPSQFEL